jgi:hypothetical protein
MQELPMLPLPRIRTGLRLIVLSCALVLGVLAGTPGVAEAATKAPEKPAVASFSNNAVRLTWKAVAKASAYRVKYSASSKFTHPSYLTVTTPTVEIGTLKASRKYYFKVRALQANGRALTTYSKTTKVKTRSKKSYSLLSPTGLKATENHGDELTLAWTAQGTTNRYLLRWATKKSMKGASSRTITGTTTLVDGLKRGTPYYFTVEVRSAKNTSLSQRTSVLKVTTAKKISFGTPSGLTISKVNPTDITVAWKAVRKAPQYQLAYTSAGWDEATYVPSTTTSVKLDGLTANTAYSIRVRVLDTAGQPAGEFSTVASARTPTHEAALRVASYNVMCHTCSAKSNAPSQPWTVRRASVVSTIEQADPDVVAVQEARQSWLDDPNDSGDKKLNLSQFEDLVNRLGTPWALTNTARNNCVKSTTPTKCVYKYQGAADDVRIIYRTDRIKLLKDSSGATRQGSLLLPAKPVDDPNWTDPSPKARYLAWAFLQQKSTGKKFLLADVHLEPRNDSDTSPDRGCGTSANPVCGKIRQAQAEAAAAKLAALNTEGLPVIFAGDVSSSRAELGGNLPYNALLGSGLKLIDPLRLADGGLRPVYAASTSAPAETRLNIAFNSVNQYERAARCYNCRVNGAFDPSRVNSYNGAYNDYILVNSRVRVSEFAQVLDVDANGNFVGVIPSDHNLIRATLWLP